MNTFLQFSVVKTTVLLADIKDGPTVNEIYKQCNYADSYEFQNGSNYRTIKNNNFVNFFFLNSFRATISG